MTQQAIDYKERQKRCRCLTPERRGFIQSAMDHSSDFPDGAFWAYMEEKEIDASELEAFSTDHDCAKQVPKQVQG